MTVPRRAALHDNSMSAATDFVNANLVPGVLVRLETYCNDCKEFCKLKPDYRENTYPLDESGAPNFCGKSGEDHLGYITWLSEHLASIEVDPAPQQVELCQALSAMPPANAMRCLGSDPGIEHANGIPGPDELNDSAAIVGTELVWPYDVSIPPDVGYRVPLAIVLRPVRNAAMRIELLDVFFSMYFDYSQM